MMYSKSLISTALIFLIAISCTRRLPNEGIILDQPGFPFIFELNQGESQKIIRSYNGKKIERTVKVNSIRTFMETNNWFSDSLGKKNYYQADVELDVSGQIVTLHHRPYQMPVTVNGLRINIENIKEWDEHGSLGKTGTMKKQVRIAICLEDEPWGPQSVVFPLQDYRWRASVYNNTWSGLVPFNLLYYHRGEDYGAIPDLLEVVSSIDGKIVSTPVPEGAKGSNGVVIESSDGIIFRYAHMNYENIVKDYIPGKEIKAGTVIGKTGMTWNGKKSQYNDPHLHVELSIRGVDVNSFPYLMEAYLRKYDDKAFAIAGGYRFAVPNEKIELDASRSFGRNGSPMKKTEWNLSDGRIINEPLTSIIYSKPGIYCEELTVETNEGDFDKDFLYVTVYNPSNGNNIASGWAYFYPVRGIKPGDEVLFWNRLTGTTSDVIINYGDGSSDEIIRNETRHIFKKAGEYVVTLKSTVPDNGPVTLKMEVVVREK
jgi:murein DD-endopeptidase MepM/ murein hydrolase activator NlpD